MGVTIVELAKNPQPWFDATKQINEGLREADPQKAYEGLARHAVVLIGGPNYVPDHALEERNRVTFLQSVAECIGAIGEGKGRIATEEMGTWDNKWENADRFSAQTVLLPENLMPVALQAVTAVKGLLDDHVVFISPKSQKTRERALREHLEWVLASIASKTVNSREFFGQKIAEYLPVCK